MRRDDLLAEEYECLITLWAIEDKVEVVETPTEIQLFYKGGALAEMEQTWDSLDSRQKISVATLVCLHFGIPLLAEDLACMTMNPCNASQRELCPSDGCRPSSTFQDGSRAMSASTVIAGFKVFNGE